MIKLEPIKGEKVILKRFEKAPLIKVINTLKYFYFLM